MDRIAEYRTRCAALATGFRDARSNGQCVGIRKPTSNLFRRRHASGKRLLDVRSFNHVIGINSQTRTADVEGMTTYETLVAESLRQGLLPEVVPQLKTITVGGAVSGLGIESSSFRYGLVHETVQEMDVLTGNGDIVTCSPYQNEDLFFGFPNSYGTLGYALRLKLRLIPAQPYVHLTHTRFTDPCSFFAHLATACKDGAADFIDGTLFSKNEMYVSRAVFAGSAPPLSDYTYMDIYYRSIQGRQDDWLTSSAYIWRWDTDWFWCSKHFGVQNPLIRVFARFALNSHSYQFLMRLSQKLLPATPAIESVIQDVHVPGESAPALWEFLSHEIGIFPVWLCPFRTSAQTYHLCGLEPDRLYFNFGFWDMIPNPFEYGHYNKLIESKVAELGGRKGLYSSSYYAKDTFWSLYDKPLFDALKKTYDPSGLFPDLYDKCVGESTRSGS